MSLFLVHFIRPFSHDECTIVLAFRVLFQADWPCALLMFRISFYYYSCTYVSCYHHYQIEQRVPHSTILQSIDLRSCCAPYHPCSCSCFSYITPIAVTFFGTSSHYLYGAFTYLNNISDHFQVPYHYIYTLILPIFTAKDRYPHLTL